jgi:hypothetical protein
MPPNAIGSTMSRKLRGVGLSEWRIWILFTIHNSLTILAVSNSILVIECLTVDIVSAWLPVSLSWEFPKWRQLFHNTLEYLCKVVHHLNRDGLLFGAMTPVQIDQTTSGMTHDAWHTLHPANLRLRNQSPEWESSVQSPWGIRIGLNSLTVDWQNVKSIIDEEERRGLINFFCFGVCDPPLILRQCWITSWDFRLDCLYISANGFSSISHGLPLGYQIFVLFRDSQSVLHFFFLMAASMPSLIFSTISVLLVHRLGVQVFEEAEPLPVEFCGCKGNSQSDHTWNRFHTYDNGMYMSIVLVHNSRGNLSWIHSTLVLLCLEILSVVEWQYQGIHHDMCHFPDLILKATQPCNYSSQKSIWPFDANTADTDAEMLLHTLDLLLLDWKCPKPLLLRVRCYRGNLKKTIV